MARKLTLAAVYEPLDIEVGGTVVHARVCVMPEARLRLAEASRERQEEAVAASKALKEAIASGDVGAASRARATLCDAVAPIVRLAIGDGAFGELCAACGCRDEKSPVEATEALSAVLSEVGSIVRDVSAKTVPPEKAARYLTGARGAKPGAGSKGERAR